MPRSYIIISAGFDLKAFTKPNIPKKTTNTKSNKWVLSPCPANKPDTPRLHAQA